MLAHSISGTGSPTLVLLHFYGSSRHEWHTVLPHLEPRFRCIAADAPGFGDSADVAGYTVEEMTAHVLDLLASLAPEPCVVVGHSMMGKVAMIAASRRPANLVGVVLVAPSPLNAEPTPEDVRLKTVAAQASPEAAREFFVQGAKSPLDNADIERGIDDVLRANPVAWKRWPQSGSREDWTATVDAIAGKIALPALLVVGEYDPAIPLDFQKKHTLPRLSNGSLEVISGIGHLIPLEAPAELAAMIKVFLGKL